MVRATAGRLHQAEPFGQRAGEEALEDHRPHVYGEGEEDQEGGLSLPVLLKAHGKDGGHGRGDDAPGADEGQEEPLPEAQIGSEGGEEDFDRPGEELDREEGPKEGRRAEELELREYRALPPGG